MEHKDKIRIVACAKALLNNTENIYLKQILEYFIDDFSEFEEYTDYQVIYKVIFKICEDGYNTSGFGLEEIPHESVYCFKNKYSKECFDVYLNHFNDSEEEVVIGYTDLTDTGYRNFNAKNIPDAISKYNFN